MASKNNCIVLILFLLVHRRNCHKYDISMDVHQVDASNLAEMLGALETLRNFASKIDFGAEGDYSGPRPSKVAVAAEEIFKRFTQIYNRSYIQDEREYEFRKAVFMESLKRHFRLNKEGSKYESAKFGINKFSDWTPDEFRSLLRSHEFGGSKRKTFRNSEFQGVREGQLQGCTYRLEDPPKAVDWRKHGKMTAVKNQGHCGSCWAFVATEQVESYWAINNMGLDALSVQEFISCAPSLGCNGGNTCQALNWLQTAIYNETERYRLVSASEYPYEAKETTCKFGKTSKKGATISGVCGCSSMVGREDIMVKVVAQRGPLGVNVNSILWHDYVGGIIQRHCSDLTINHAVQLVGYDLSGPVPYWIVRNTWGPDFGEDGYLRIKLGENLCGLALEPSFIYI